MNKKLSPDVKTQPEEVRMPEAQQEGSDTKGSTILNAFQNLRFARRLKTIEAILPPDRN